MKKDQWDKIGILGTFLSSTIMVVFTTMVTIHTNKLSNQVEEFRSMMDENKMINDLVRSISNDTVSNVKFDFSLLALERYLRNTNKEGDLKPQDKEMLIGFAQSLILDRKNLDSTLTKDDLNKILIPEEFLKKYDTTRLNEIYDILANKNKIANYPSEKTEVNNNQVIISKPVAQTTDIVQSTTISNILKKIVYIQYSNSLNHSEVDDIQQKFISNKWVVPKTQHVKGNYSNIIKYFHKEDQELAIEANKLLKNKFSIVAIAISKYEKLVPKGQIEIWISN